MPSLQKFHANVSRHVKLMDKNLCANLIRNDHIITTRAKAKRAQSNIEQFLAKSLHQHNLMADKPLEYKLANNPYLRYLQPPDLQELGPKILSEIFERYPQRSHGFTRIIKLEPRLGEDKAPMSVLELVDSEYEIKLWYTAKIVARLQLQGLELDDITKKDVEKLTKLRVDGESVFDKTVEQAKMTFFKYNPETQQIEDESIVENLKNMPNNLQYYDGSYSSGSKTFNVKPRPQREDVEIPKSPHCT